MGRPMVPISREDLPRMVGKQIHLSWARNGCVWQLMSIEGDKIHLRTPSTWRPRIADAKDACYIRLHEPQEVTDGTENGIQD